MLKKRTREKGAGAGFVPVGKAGRKGEEIMNEHLFVDDRARELEKALQTARRLERLLNRSEAAVQRSIGVKALENVAGEIAVYFTQVLGAVAGYGRLLHREMDRKDPLRRYAGLILAHADAGKSLTNRLMSVGERGRVEPRLLNINQLIREISRLLSGIMKKGVRIRTVLAAGELPVMADPAQMGRVFTSLVRHVGEAMHKGGTITVLTRLLPVEMCAVAEGSNGCALLSISTEDAARLTARRKPARERPGKRFLLAVSAIRRIIEEHRGAIRIGRKDQAIEFNVYLPVLRAG